MTLVSGTGTQCLFAAAAQTNTLLVAAPTAKYAVSIQWVDLSNGYAAGGVQILDGSSGTCLWGAQMGVQGQKTVNFQGARPKGTQGTGIYCSSTAAQFALNLGYTIGPG